MSGVVLDAGAFVALERRDPKAADLFNTARKNELPLVTSAAVVGQIWHGDRRQAAIASALRWRTTSVVDLTHADGRAIGKMLAVSGTMDVIDAHVALLARQRGWPVVTSDPNDLRQLDPSLSIWKV